MQRCGSSRGPGYVRLVDRILERLKGVRQRRGYHMALCPAHDDREPSLSVSEADGRIRGEGDAHPNRRLRTTKEVKPGTSQRAAALFSGSYLPMPHKHS